VAPARAPHDRERLRRTVHQLGSAAAALGLAQLFARCSAIEAVALSPSADPAIMVDELAMLRRRSLEALDERLRLLQARSEAFVQ
jgi:HPt (histidine-containing phosphotransfer) domain-containing protein